MLNNKIIQIMLNFTKNNYTFIFFKNINRSKNFIEGFDKYKNKNHFKWYLFYFK
jgi:hypothetical protein